jgi:SAM-dependent methyltransferase
VSDFSRAWLALREPADARARARAAQHALLPPLRRHLQGRRIHVLDLGCGTGANLRWLAPRLPAPQHWRLVDHDAALLADAARSAHGAHAGAAPELAFEQQDLAAGLPDLHEVDLVTAAALLDLVSRRWLDGLVAACAARRTALLLALSYDGRIAFLPRHRDDARVRDALNRHQLRDKGFAAALGPGAAAAAGTHLQRTGYRVTQVRSDWWLTRADAALHDALIGGWADAVREQAGSGGGAWIERWQAWRLAHREALRVGHVDLLALPPA